MNEVIKLQQFLTNEHADFSIIAHAEPIHTIEDAKKYFNIEKTVPTFIMDTDKGLMAFMVSSKRGRLDLRKMKEKFNFSRLKFADSKKIKEMTGYGVGNIPLIGHNLECILDKEIFKYEYVYGGAGVEGYTLKIAPVDLERLNKVIAYIECD